MSAKQHANALESPGAGTDDARGAVSTDGATSAEDRFEWFKRADSPLLNLAVNPRHDWFYSVNCLECSAAVSRSWRAAPGADAPIRFSEGLVLFDSDTVRGLLDPASSDPLARLRLMAALAELQELDLRRAISAADAAGHNQQTIAKEANLSQPTVSRLIARLRRHPDLLEETPRELLLRRQVGEIGTPELLSRLSEWPWTFGHPDHAAPEGAESWVPGTWDDMIGLNRDLLREGEYDEIRDRVTASMTAVKTGV